MKKIFLLFVLLQAAAFSQTFWERTEPYSYGLNQIVIGGGDTLYGTLNSGFTRSVNGGATWTNPIIVNYVRELAVAPNGYLYVAQNQEAMSRSTNKGNSFTKSATGITETVCSSVLVTANGTVLAGTRSGIFRSTTEGTSWTKIAGFAQLGEDTNIVALGRHNTTIYALATMPSNNPEWTVAYRSTDDGATWTKGTNKLNGVTVYNLTVRPNGHFYSRSNRGAYASTDGGNSWSLLGFENTTVYDVAVDSGGTIYAALSHYDSTNILYKSTNNGNSWLPVNTPYIGFSKLTVGRNGTLFIGQDQTYRSTDNGATWKAVAVLYPNTTIFTESPKQELFVTAGGSAYQTLYRSSDFGVTWSPLKTGVVGVPIVGFYGDTIFVADNYYNAKLFRSVDNAKTFKSVSNISVLNGYVNAIIGTIYKSIIAGTSNGIYRSVDHGKAWTKVSSSPVTFLQQVPNGTMYGYRSFFGSGVMRSTDSGSTWTELKTGMGNTIVHALAFAQNGDVFAGSDAGLFRTTDAGNNWVRLDTQKVNKPYGIYVAVNKEGKLFFGGAKSGINSIVYQSTNNGATWTQIPNNITTIDNQASLRSLFTSSNGYLFAGTTSGLFKSAAKTTSVVAKNASIPETFVLKQNYPNPFNPTTTIGFTIPASGFISLKVYDVLGKEISALVNERLTAGSYETTFNAGRLSSGIYFYKISNGEFTEIKKMQLLK